MTAQWHDLTLRTVTPAFLGRFGSIDPEPTVVPFPVPSLRGALAYWLRALAGAHLGDNIDGLHAVESAVFGAARTENGGGPSPIQLRGGRVQLAVLPADRQRDGLRYLMGPGLTAVKDPPPRCLSPGSLELRVRNNGSPAAADLFLAAMWALRAYGGIGARTRRGFGTLALDQIPDLGTSRFDHRWLRRDSVADLDTVLGCVAAAIGDLNFGDATRHLAPDAAPRYPCFAPGFYQHSADDVDQLHGSAADWKAALDNAGAWLWGYRHGADRRIPGTQPPSGTHSRTYTNVVQPYLNDPVAGRYVQLGPVAAAALGLPIPYSDHQGPRDNKGKPGQRYATINAYVGGQQARRASPLWLRVRRDGSVWRLRSLAFYNEWLPPSQSSLRIKQEGRRPAGSRQAQLDLLTQTQVNDELKRWFGTSPPN